MYTIKNNILNIKTVWKKDDLKLEKTPRSSFFPIMKIVKIVRVNI